MRCFASSARAGCKRPATRRRPKRFTKARSIKAGGRASSTWMTLTEIRYGLRRVSVFRRVEKKPAIEKINYVDMRALHRNAPSCRVLVAPALLRQCGLRRWKKG